MLNHVPRARQAKTIFFVFFFKRRKMSMLVGDKKEKYPCQEEKKQMIMEQPDTRQKQFSQKIWLKNMATVAVMKMSVMIISLAYLHFYVIELDVTVVYQSLVIAARHTIAKQHILLAWFPVIDWFLFQAFVSLQFQFRCRLFCFTEGVLTKKIKISPFCSNNGYNKNNNGESIIKIRQRKIRS